MFPVKLTLLQTYHNYINKVQEGQGHVDKSTRHVYCVVYTVDMNKLIERFLAWLYSFKKWGGLG